MDKVVSLCKRRGFVFPGSEIYGGLAGTWDYGPTGCLLKKNIKDIWWHDIVEARDDVVGVDAAIMMNPKAWEASGHTEAFSDPLVECKKCQKRFRADKVQTYTEDLNIMKKLMEDGLKYGSDEIFDSNKNYVYWICESCGSKNYGSESRQFNLLVKAYLGVVEGQQSEVYLRGEITNGAQVNFKNVLNSARVKIPFGIAQVGKAFRNEITPGNFTFRSREFEQMEVQFYIKPDEREGKKWFEYWKQNRMAWYVSLGVRKEHLRFRDHAQDERAHYAQAATDIEYLSPWGWQEFMGIHHRGDWDLKRHQEYSGADMTYRDPETDETYIPWDIETSAGVDRSLLFFLVDAYREDGERIYLALHPKLAPYKAAVFPLLANKPQLVEKARSIYEELKKHFTVSWDDRGNIGKRYYAQDEIGTPYCITVDFDSLEDQAVTLRDRDTMQQERVKIGELEKALTERLR